MVYCDFYFLKMPSTPIKNTSSAPDDNKKSQKSTHSATSFRIKSIFQTNPFRSSASSKFPAKIHATNGNGNSRSPEKDGNYSSESGGNEKEFLCRIMVICTLGSFLFGYDTGVINGALPFMRDDLGLTSVTVGVVTSSLLVGAAIGAVASNIFTIICVLKTTL